MKSEPLTRRRGQPPQHGLSLYSDNQGKHDGGAIHWEEGMSLWGGVRQASSRAGGPGVTGSEDVFGGHDLVLGFTSEIMLGLATGAPWSDPFVPVEKWKIWAVLWFGGANGFWGSPTMFEGDLFKEKPGSQGSPAFVR